MHSFSHFFVSQIKIFELLKAAEASSFDNITRLDIHIDQIVNLPRRYIQLFQSYVKVFTDKNCQEYKDMSGQCLNLIHLSLSLSF